MLVRSPQLTSHKWRELVSSGRLVCRYHVTFLWCSVCFVLFCFCLFAFTEAAALRSTVFRYAYAPTATRSYITTVCVILCSCIFHYFVSLEMSLFPSITVQFPFSLCMESTSYVFSFRMVFSYLTTTGWVFYRSYYGRIQSINITEVSFCSAWIFASVLVCLHGDYVRVQYNGGFLPGIILLTRCYCH